MDRGIGDILEGMDPAVLDETIIVFLGDNGTPFSVEEADFADRGARSSNGKGSIYETGIRVPLTITSGKNWREYHDCTMLGRARDVCMLSEDRVRRPGRVVPSPLMVTDLFDTLARLGGRTPTTGDDSYGFAGCLQNPGRGCGGPATSPTRVVYAERFEYTTDATTGIDELSFGSAAIRQGSTKLTAELDASHGCFRYGLYDLSTDPFERTSRAFTDPATLASMMTTLSSMGVPWQAGIPICH